MKISKKINWVVLLFLMSSCNLLSQDKNKEKINPEDVGVYDTDLLSADFHKERREKLRALMPAKSVSIVYASPIRNRSNDVDFEYHQDPNFNYLSGLNEPHAVLLIFKEKQKINGVKTNEVIFVQSRDPKMELWNGKRLGVKGVKQLKKINAVFSSDELNNSDLKLKNLTVYVVKDKNDTRDTRSSLDLFDLKKIIGEKTKVSEKNLIQLNKWMAKLREIKTKEELVLMRKAIDITCISQTELMKNLDTLMAEHQSEALVEFHFKHHGAEYTGFPSIHGSGENSCILHYTTTRRKFTKNDLLVSDIGAEYHGYTADVTRTLPVNGKYSKEQAIIYNIVLEAQSAGIDSCLAGNSFWEPGRIAKEIITKRLLELGIIKKPSEVRQYFPHGTSHYLGLDVHDAGTYGPLTPGQVITVEPGIYIPEGSDCDPKWWNIGVRIEDDILITSGKPENLSDCAPRTIPEIEAIMNQK